MKIQKNLERALLPEYYVEEYVDKYRKIVFFNKQMTEDAVDFWERGVVEK